MKMKYKNIFFDLDDTLWNFTENAYDSFVEVYNQHRLGRYFDSFEHFYTLYKECNTRLWVEYGNGKITKEELNNQRFYYPLEKVGVFDVQLSQSYAADFFKLIPTKKKLLPNAVELLDYLAPKYRLFILSNGFKELQYERCVQRVLIIILVRLYCRMIFLCISLLPKFFILHLAQRSH